MQKENNLQVQMFGKFRIVNQGIELSADNIKSAMLVRLMAYIFNHRDNNMTSTELIDALWPNESSDNPIGALRNLVYRLRRLLEKSFGPGGVNRLLVTGNGFYCCNKEINLSTDVERFEKYCRDAKACAPGPDKIDKCKRALQLYKGEYMSGYNDVYWLESMATFYSSMYLDMIRECTALLEKYERYEEVEQIIREALNNGALDEDLHACFVRSLTLQGKEKLAMEQYKKSVKMLYETLETTKMESMQREYERLMKKNHGAQRDLTVIEKELGIDAGEGAFWCEYGVFRHIYCLERRRLRRCSASIFLILISVRQEKEPGAQHPLQEKKEKNLAPAMKTLREVLIKVLRSGDVVARYSRNQYILMLPSCQYSSVKGITDRIDRKFESAAKESGGLWLRYDVDEVK